MNDDSEMERAGKNIVRGRKQIVYICAANKHEKKYVNTNEMRANESERKKTPNIDIHIIHNQAFLFMLQKIREIVLRLFQFYLK